MPRLIDAKELERQVKATFKDSNPVLMGQMLRWIRCQTTIDAVTVVRCKDCKYCDPENLNCDHPMGTTFPFLRKPDDYCSYGERRNNG